MSQDRSVQQLLTVSGVVAAGRFDPSGAALETAGEVDGTSAEAVALMCAANSAMGALQVRGWAMYSGDDRFSGLSGFALAGGRHVVLVAEGTGMFVDAGKADLDEAFAALVGPPPTVSVPSPPGSGGDREPGHRIAGVLALPGVEAACWFTDNGALLDYAGLDETHAAVLAQLGAANNATARLQCDGFSALSGQEWSPALGWVLRGPGASLCVLGNVAVIADNARICLSALFAGLGDERAPDLEDRDAPAAVPAVASPVGGPGPEFLSAGWMAAYRDAWNADEFLRRSLRRFSATVRYAVSDAPVPPMDLVVEAGVAAATHPAGTETPDFVLTADTRNWARLVTGDLRPRAAIRTGRLRFRGSLLTATRHIDAFEESLRLMTRVR